MRVLILFSLFAMAGFAAAAPEPGLPTNVCSGKFCGPRQQRIWDHFQTASGLDHERTPGVYSGGCFHNTPMLDGEREHYAVALIESAGDRLFFDGRFSFFTDGNPYSHLNMEDARERFNQLFLPGHELEVNSSFAVAVFEDRFIPRRYWFRQGSDDSRMVLVGYFGALHTILCELTRNPN